MISPRPLNQSERVIRQYQALVQKVIMRFWARNKSPHGAVDWRDREHRYETLYTERLYAVWAGVMLRASRIKVKKKFIQADDAFVEWLRSYAPILAANLANVDKEGLEAAMRLYATDPQTASAIMANSVNLRPDQVMSLGRRAETARSRGYTGDALNESIQRWEFEALSNRAKMIAVTELNRGYIEAQEISIKSAVKDGLMSGNIAKVWETAEDELVCDVCGPMDGESVPLSEDFDIEGGKPPAHPWCRCTVNYENWGTE